MKIKYSPLGDGAIVIEVLGGIGTVRSITARLEYTSDALIQHSIVLVGTVGKYRTEKKQRHLLHIPIQRPSKSYG